MSVLAGVARRSNFGAVRASVCLRVSVLVRACLHVHVRKRGCVSRRTAPNFEAMCSGVCPSESARDVGTPASRAA
jgi:hypothetical protein